MKKIIIFLILLLIVYSCAQLSTINERGFRNFVRENLISRNVQFSSLKCFGSMRSRGGFCSFQTNNNELEKFAKFVSNGDEASLSIESESKIIFFNSVDGCLSTKDSERLKTVDKSHEIHNEKGEFESYATILSKAAKIYQIIPPFTDDKKRNIRLVQNYLISDAVGDYVCVELEYPFG